MNSPTYKRSQNAIFSAVGDDILALHVHHGQCYGMENVAADVWSMLGEPADIDRICAELVERYDVEPDLCRSDVVRLLEQMRQEGLVEEVDAA